MSAVSCAHGLHFWRGGGGCLDAAGGVGVRFEVGAGGKGKGAEVRAASAVCTRLLKGGNHMGKRDRKGIEPATRRDMEGRADILTPR